MVDRPILRHRGDPKQWLKGNCREGREEISAGDYPRDADFGTGVLPKSSLKFLS